MLAEPVRAFGRHWLPGALRICGERLRDPVAAVQTARAHWPPSLIGGSTLGAGYCERVPSRVWGPGIAESDVVFAPHVAEALQYRPS